VIIAGPCLLNDNQAEIDNAIDTARQLYAIDPSIYFRCKLWGGGTAPDRYKEGIGFGGLAIFKDIHKLNKGQSVGTEIQTKMQMENLKLIADYIWIGARNSHNYGLLHQCSEFVGDIFIKRGPGMTIDEVIGLHDICRDIYGYKPIMIERGINTFCRTPEKRWTTDFDGMIRLTHERTDIQLMLDPSHAGGRKEYILPLVKAACAIGVRNFMLEVYANPELTQTDKTQAISIDEFKPIYDYIKTHGGK
jgi:3-deoxy-7-phosphoheptulonate synthase